MPTVFDALRGARRPSPSASRSQDRRAAVLVGGGGDLGSAVLEQMLGERAFDPLLVLVTQQFSASVAGLQPLRVPSFDDDLVHDPLAAAASPALPGTATLAVLVFDRARSAHGRERAFVHPAPEQLPQMAAWLQRHGVRHLVIVMPHAAGALPEALRRGLANLDEQAVSAAGFDHVVFVRSAQRGGTPPAARWLQRLADTLLQQLRLMLPASQQPLRVRKLAQFVAALAAQLPTSSSGTRVVSPELLWQAAQHDDASPLVAAWLAGDPWPAPPAPRMRL